MGESSAAEVAPSVPVGGSIGEPAAVTDSLPTDKMSTTGVDPSVSNQVSIDGADPVFAGQVPGIAADRPSVDQAVSVLF